MCSGVGGIHAAPVLAWHHSQGGSVGFRGNCATGLCVYTGDRYPAVYRGRLFFLDYGRNWLRAAELDASYRIGSTLGFGRDMQGPVDLVAQPGTKDLVYAALGTNGVFRLRYLGSQQPPVAVASATPAWGSGDLDVVLSAAGSSDPENQDLTYAWELGDGGTAATEEVTHHYAGDTNYVARLTVTDTEGLSASDEVLVSPNNTPPSILALTTPLDGGTYVPGQPLRLDASATDAEDGRPEATWTLDLVHDHHLHPSWATGEGLRTFVVPDAHGTGDVGDVHFFVRLTVTDARGLVDERAVEIYDPASQPQAHLVELATTSVRAGQTIAPVGHVDYAYGRIAPKLPTLTWDWGDGTADVFPDAAHHADTRPAHVYALPGTYKLRLVAELEGVQNVESAVIEVAQPRPSVAVFAPLDEERWVPRAQQEEIVAALETGLFQRASEVRAFSLGQGEALAQWMESLVSDSIADVLVLLDFMPESALPDGLGGSLLERWVAGGNGLVWSGLTPFQDVLADDGTVTLTVQGADAFFAATAPFIVQGTGQQTPTALGTSVLPSLAAFRSIRALRYQQLGPDWHVARIFAEDGNHESDALELEHASRGFYAQFHCADDASLPRAAVLTEYLRDKIGKSKLGASSTPGRR
jgi:PKD repeat protein